MFTTQQIIITHEAKSSSNESDLRSNLKPMVKIPTGVNRFFDVPKIKVLVTKFHKITWIEIEWKNSHHYCRHVFTLIANNNITHVNCTFSKNV